MHACVGFDAIRVSFSDPAWPLKTTTPAARERGGCRFGTSKSSVQEQGDQDDDRNGHAEKKQQK
jgi:hypothetical protein